MFFLCSYNIRIFERYLETNSGTKFSHFYIDLWCIFIIKTTVGYDDLAPTNELVEFLLLYFPCWDSCLFCF